MDTEMKGFDRASIPTILIPVIFPFALGKVFGFEPPWPDEPGYIAGFLDGLIIFICFSTPIIQKYKLRLRQVIALFVCIISMLTYFFLFAFFVYEEPTTGSKIVSGYACTAEAQYLISAGEISGECPFLPSTALESAAYKPEAIWTSSSIRVVQLTFLIVWTLFFASATYGTAISYAHSQRKVRGRSNN
ncbi:hypothetical protein [uncultured Erythrobacter sp.]|uniref:hypothetical protein n=1 Tax=uncultured Erythrobacter sp. TaxID=263913 RepID=UPI002659FE53|nr:hypothetical protein [uncultured Erythrobacter sp.]